MNDNFSENESNGCGDKPQIRLTKMELWRKKVYKIGLKEDGEEQLRQVNRFKADQDERMKMCFDLNRRCEAMHQPNKELDSKKRRNAVVVTALISPSLNQRNFTEEQTHVGTDLQLQDQEEDQDKSIKTTKQFKQTLNSKAKKHERYGCELSKLRRLGNGNGWKKRK